MFFVQQGQAEQALARLRDFADDDALQPIDGKSYSAGELRRAIEREPYLTLIAQLILAGLMAGLWLWARRAPLPAIGCALALFIVVQVGSALIDPTSLFKGLIVKIVALAALGAGLKASLAARALMSRPGP
jgi:hypothetical protein